MKQLFVAAVLCTALAVSMPALAETQTWKDAPVSCTHCSAKVKADPDAHPRDCMVACANGGFGIFTADGKFLKFDKAGNEKALAALKKSDKKDHIHATVTGELKGDTIEVTSFELT